MIFKINHLLFSSFILLCIVISACEDYVPVPKPRSYPRVIYPEKTYQSFDKNFCNFTFSYPTYARIVQDTSFFEDRPANPCWFDVRSRNFNASIHCTYSSIRNRRDFDKLVTDAFEMTNKHNVKANYIDEFPIQRKADNVYGILFDIKGPVASPTQFFVTDSVKHFLRGSLYFETKTRPDSIAPVLEFVNKDVQKLIETIKWN